MDLDWGMRKRLTLNLLKKTAKRKRVWGEINALEGIRRKRGVQGCWSGGL